jgi:transcriptional antiterminator NusG
VAGVLVALSIAAAIAFQSAQGQNFWRFAQSSRGELRKVIWPTRQETVQTTLTVFVFVLILGVFFWLLDMGLVSITRLLTGRGLTMALKWYVVHAYSNFENKVKQVPRGAHQAAGLEEKFGEILVPTEEVVEMKEGQKRRSERKFFPGYVLVQMELDDETWHLVKDVPKVLGFIGGSSDRPAPISDKEAEASCKRVEEGTDKPRPKVLFEPGEVVRVVDGPFNDFNGVVEER